MRYIYFLAIPVLAIWSASPALNPMYVPWGTEGAEGVLAEGCVLASLNFIAILLSSKLIVKNLNFYSFAIGCILIISFALSLEVLFWNMLDKDQNKGIILRQLFGIRLGAGLTVISYLNMFLKFERNRANFVLKDLFKFGFRISILFFLIELLLFIFRDALRHGNAYYALDCAMFAIALVAMATLSGIGALAVRLPGKA